MLKLNHYDIEFAFTKKDKLILTGTLSKAYLPDTVEDEDRPRIINVSAFGDIPDARIKSSGSIYEA